MGQASPTGRTAQERAEPDDNTAVLVVYWAEQAPLRTAIADHLYSFGRSGRRPTLYLNLAVRRVPAWVGRLGIGLVIFHTTFLATRWHPAAFVEARRRAAPLRRLRARRVAIPQDEFIQTDLLGAFLRDFAVDHVFSTVAPEDWETIYRSAMARGVTVSRVLTGYLDSGTIDQIGTLAAESDDRPLDVVYRAWRPEYWLGRHGLLKAQVGDVVARHAPEHGLVVDISLEPEDTLVGDAWLRFLLRSRWTIGVEGGASILDRDGSIRAATLAYQAAHPNASFDEVEAACFPNRDGQFRLFLLSPRHLEAAATRTAQALVEGEYNGILQADRHYLPIRADFSNVDQVLEQMKDDDVRSRLAEQAWADLVGSGAYSYTAFVEDVLSVVPRVTVSRIGRAVRKWETGLDQPSWAAVRVRFWLKPRARRILDRIGLLAPAVRLRDWLRGREGTLPPAGPTSVP